ncbi:MAG: glycosyltransferase family 2 protein [Planctomycetota bacterium]
MKPLDLSISIVCKNNAATIARTLESVRPLASEIVAVDSGSTDGTLDLLARAGATVIRSEWKGHVATKQMALEACMRTWVFCIDSDESLEPELAGEVARVVRTPTADGYHVNRKVFYQGRALNHVWQPEWRLRLVRSGRFAWAGLDPHDKLVRAPGSSAPTTADLIGDLRHDSIDDFQSFLAKQVQHASVMARSMRAEGRRGSVVRLVTSPPGSFLKQAVIKGGWRDGWAGLAAAMSTAVSTAMKHAILLDLSRSFGPEPGGPGSSSDSDGSGA